MEGEGGQGWRRGWREEGVEERKSKSDEGRGVGEGKKRRGEFGGDRKVRRYPAPF